MAWLTSGLLWSVAWAMVAGICAGEALVQRRRLKRLGIWYRHIWEPPQPETLGSGLSWLSLALQAFGGNHNAIPKCRYAGCSNTRHTALDYCNECRPKAIDQYFSRTDYYGVTRLWLDKAA